MWMLYTLQQEQVGHSLPVTAIKALTATKALTAIKASI